MRPGNARSPKFKRVIVTRPGGPEVLQLREEALPEPGPGEVRVKILATGVSYADLLMREGVHPETPRTVPFTLGWDLAGVVDKTGAGVSRFTPGQRVGALPVTGGYAQFICLPQEELVLVPAGLDPAEVVCLVFNYMTAYQMMHRAARVQPGQRVLIHAASGGIGTALLQLGRVAGLEMYGTASAAAHERVTALGATPIDYKHVDFVEEIRRLTGDGVDVVFDGMGGSHLWRSVRALRAGGTVVAYGLTSSLSGGQLARGRRYRFHGLAVFGLIQAATRLIPGGRRMRFYSVQRLKRRRPGWYQEDLTVLLDLLRQGKIQPIIAARLPLEEAARAHELLGRGGVTGKIVLLCDT
ncbi:MAG TPA: medium chain dehydrogenase/reductase family protein [Archangium sp.]|uniref:medium chain dehydrogenase/reductase family protein n=1 Tax=Archangium sp. TaxID=1872627 RepID=UPI002E36DC42|nr:medium chain dehydrogenase/reductase family protein [Archangium sp.]HEX5746285.1 medium chain dehydrogenase/reductase family protein [Archangium sp.]